MDDKLRRLIERWHSLPLWRRWYLYCCVRVYTLRADTRASITGFIMSIFAWYIYSTAGVYILQTVVMAAASGVISGFVALRRLRQGYTLAQSLCVSGAALAPAAALFRAVYPVAGWAWAWLISSASAVITALMIMVIRDTVLVFRRSKDPTT